MAADFQNSDLLILLNLLAQNLFPVCLDRFEPFWRFNPQPLPQLTFGALPKISFGSLRQFNHSGGETHCTGMTTDPQ